MNLIGNVNLHNTSDYQLIYSSQLYGTFFNLYAKFDASLNGDIYTIKTISLKVINYKGIVNIGISRASQLLPDPNDTNGHVLNLEVQALNGNTDVELKNLNYAIKRGENLNVDRKLIPMHTNGNPMNNSLFDEEFFFREGVYADNKFPRRKPDPNEVVDNSLTDIKGGWICPRSTNSVL